VVSCFFNEVNDVRIIHLVNHCNHGHGNAHVAIDLACMQAQHGHDVIYASGGGDYVDLLKKYGVRHEFILQNSRNPLQLVHSLFQLQRLCLSFRPDLLHGHMMAGAVFGYLSSRVCRVPLITTVHNSFDKHSVLMRLADRVVAVSEAERKSLLGTGYKAARLSVVINGPNHSPREGFLVSGASGAIEVKQPCVVTVCGLHKRKGVNDLIRGFCEASAELPDWRLYIVGDGPDRQVLTELAATLGAKDKVLFLGSVGNPAQILSQADIFVLASYADPCSLAIGEAREAGCAIIATGVGGTPELLEFGNAGKLVDPGSAQQIAYELKQLMTDKALRQDWRARSRRSSEYFRVTRVARDYEMIYDSAVSGK
jgi:glycosyltransferase involved in cell wall biosynthesis